MHSVREKKNINKHVIRSVIDDLSRGEVAGWRYMKITEVIEKNHLNDV